MPHKPLSFFGLSLFFLSIRENIILYILCIFFAYFVLFSFHLLDLNRFDESTTSTIEGWEVGVSFYKKCHTTYYIYFFSLLFSFQYSFISLVGVSLTLCVILYKNHTNHCLFFDFHSLLFSFQCSFMCLVGVLLFFSWMYGKYYTYTFVFFFSSLKFVLVLFFFRFI